MTKFKFELVSPESVLASKDVEMVVVPGIDGSFGVLAEHSPLLSSLKPGVVEVHNDNNDVDKIFVAGGFAEVNPSLCTILAEEAVNVEDLDRSELESKISDLSDDLNTYSDDNHKLRKTERDLIIVKAKLQAVTGNLVI